MGRSNWTLKQTASETNINMNTLLPFIVLITMVAAWEDNQDNQAYAPAEIISEGPWVDEAIWSNRGPKQVPAPVAPTLLEKLGSWWTWDRDAVKEGIFKNENIMIHIGQNLFNFVFSTLAWFTVSQIYSLTASASATPPNTPRQQRGLTITEAASEVLDAISKFENKY